MLTGIPPFYSKDREKLFKTIKAAQVKFQKFLSKDAVDLLEKFFVIDPEQRLGSGEHGLDDIKAQPFFKSIDWNAILEKNIKPPFTPKLKGPTDTRYIDPEFTTCTPKDSSVVGGTSLENESNKYEGFSYEPNKDDI